MLISPLAAKLCQKKGIDPSTLQGSGPRGRIMAADVERGGKPKGKKGETVLSIFATSPTRPEKDGYLVYDGSVDMHALASISLPIAVQCEKLLEKRYSLFDYITRATVKACLSKDTGKEPESVDVLLFEDSGQKVSAIRNAAQKSIYQLAKETRIDHVPADFHPHIVVCDAETHREQVAASLAAGNRPVFAFVARGGQPKVGIRAGRGNVRDFVLDYTFYISGIVPRQVADGIAAVLQNLLQDPVRLLLLS